MDKKILGDIDFCQTIVDSLPGFEHSKLCDIQKDPIDGAKYYTIEEIKKKRPQGNVLGSFVNDKGELVFLIADKWSHEIATGESGIGKSTQVIMSLLLVHILSHISTIIIDPKLEYYTKTASVVKENGGKVLLLNLRDPKYSELFNPLKKIAKIIASIADVGKGVVRIDRDGKTGWIYNGREYFSEDGLESAFNQEIEEKIKTAKRETKDLIAKLWPVESQKEPYWEHTAWRMPEAIIYALCMDQLSKNENERVSMAQINFSNVNKIYSKFVVSRRGLNDFDFFKRRGDDSWVYGVVKNLYFQQAETTLRNQMGFTDEAFAKYDIPSFMELTMDTTISLEDFVNQFTVIYIGFDEMDTTSMSFLSFLISYFIKELKNMADGYDNGSLPNHCSIIIDEFAALGKMEEVKRGFGYLRSRNISLHVAIQSYSQLFSLYGENDARWIIENAKTQVFLSSPDFNTIQEFSRDCGKRATVMPFSRLQDNHIEIREVPVLTCSDLAFKNSGDIFVKRSGQYPIRSKFLKCYEHEEFGTVKTLPKDYHNPLANNLAGHLYDVSRIKPRDNDDLF